MIYFGGYGHKRLNEIDDPKSFVVDEASWVICIQYETLTIKAAIDSGECFSQAEDVFWGWNNEIHEFDPENSSWTEPQTIVSHLLFCTHHYL